MKTTARKCLILAGVVSATLVPISHTPVLAQVNWYGLAAQGVSSDPDSQRNAMRTVNDMVGNLQNATQTASSFGNNGYGNVWQQFQYLRAGYSTFTMTLNSQQSSEGANEIAELSSGLDILAEAFTNYQDDIANGRSAEMSLQDMCQVLNQAASVWLQEFNQDCRRLNVGW